MDNAKTDSDPQATMLRIRGPWLALADFSADAIPRGEPWRLGSASSDAFTFKPAPDRSKHGLCIMVGKASCPMGPPIGALRDVSNSWPALSFLVTCRDEQGVPEAHLVVGGDAQSRFGIEAEPWLESTLETLHAAWVAADLECDDWIHGRIPMPVSTLASSNWPRHAPEVGLLLMARLLAAEPGPWPSPWPDWDVSLPDPWSRAASPWTPPPPWRTDGGFNMLGLASIASGSPIHGHGLPAARRHLDLASRHGRFDYDSARREVALGLIGTGRPTPPQWALAAAAGNTETRKLLIHAATSLGMRVVDLAEVSVFLAMAESHPEFCRAMLVELPWGYSPTDVEMIARKAPEPVASLALAQAISASISVPDAEPSSGRTRL